MPLAAGLAPDLQGGDAGANAVFLAVPGPGLTIPVLPTAVSRHWGVSDATPAGFLTGADA